MSEEKHVQYKYQISIDGARATWERPVWQLQSNALMFKQKSTHHQWFYKGIIPNQHYIEVETLEDIVNGICWAEQNPEQAKQIAHNATVFANHHLQLEDMYLYLVYLLKSYQQKVQHN